MTTTFDPNTIYAAATGTLSGGNLHYVTTTSSATNVRSLDFTSTTKFYCEITLNTKSVPVGETYFGVVLQSQANFSVSSAATVPPGAWLWRDDGQKFNNAAAGVALGAAIAAGGVVMIACDPVAGNLWWGSNGAWFGSGNPASGANPAYTGVTGKLGVICGSFSGQTTASIVTANFGATAYSYTPPAGFGNLLGNYAPGNDPYTVLLLHMDGANGSTSFPDAGAGSNTPHVMTPTNVTCDTSQPYLGGQSSARFPGNGYMTSPLSPSFSFGNAGGGDFTIDFWVRFNTLPTGTAIADLLQTESASAGWAIYYRAGTPSVLTIAYYGSPRTVNWSPAVNTWYHIAVERYGSTMHAYINGVATTIADSVFNAATALYLGSESAGGSFLDGWMKEVRISQGIARYQGANFTPPTKEYGIFSTTGTLAATEAGDICAFSAKIITNASLAATEAADTAHLTATAFLGARLAANETGDTAHLALTQGSTVVGAIAATEGPDTASFIIGSFARPTTTSHVRHRRSYDPTYAFGPIEPGEIATNTANRQLVLGDAPTGTPLKLLAIRFFSITSQYAAGDLAVENGVLYRANGIISPGPWNVTQWTLISADVSALIQKAGDAMAGPLLLANATPVNALEATAKGYVDGGDNAVTAAFTAADNTKVNKGGDTMTGALTLAADPVSGPTGALQASTRQYVDAAILAIPPPPTLPEAPDAAHSYGRIGGTSPSWSPVMPLAGGTFGGPVTLAADPTSGLQAATKQYIDAAIAGITIPPGQSVPTGTPLPWLTDTAPAGYLFANGQAVSRTTYAALYALFGTFFGVGNGTTTFNLPDLRDVTIIGKTTMGGAAARGLITHLAINAVGLVVGEEQHTLAATEMPAHTHAATATATVTETPHTHSYAIFNPQQNTAAGGGAPGGSTSGTTTGSASSGVSVTVAVTNAQTGGGGGHNVVQPSFVLNWIVKT